MALIVLGAFEGLAPFLGDPPILRFHPINLTCDRGHGSGIMAHFVLVQSLGKEKLPVEIFIVV